MPKSASLLFPFKQDGVNGSLARATTVNDTIASAVRLFTVTKPGERRGNMIGSFISTLKHQLISDDKLIQYENQYKAELNKQFPGVTFVEVTINKTMDDNIPALSININFTTAVTELQNISILLK